ncbi:MAG: hypothetical protein E6J14_03165 [Chloroflexi bacterium]|nr:MAG: hypothetical protein E6J14_03165 [Chloroflexota bacterium]
MLDRWTRFAPLVGVVFVVVLAVSFAITGNTPSSTDSGDKVIAYYRDHKSAQQASAFLGLYALVFGVFFFGVMRAHLRSRGAAGLAAAAFGGGVLLAVGGAGFSGFSFALADAPDKLTPAAAQALNILNNDFFFPLAAGGAIFMIGNGLAIVRTAALPVWLGWVAVVIGVANLTPVGFFAFLALLLWVLVTSILLFLRGGVGAQPAAVRQAV